MDTERGGGAALPSACRPSPCPPNPSRMGLEILVSGVGWGRESGSRMRAQPSCQPLVSTLISLRRQRGRGAGGEELMSYQGLDLDGDNLITEWRLKIRFK